LRENIDTLRGRLSSFTDKREQLKREIKRQTEDSRRHVARMNEMKPELKRLGREREQLKKFVILELFLGFDKLRISLANCRLLM